MVSNLTKLGVFAITVLAALCLTEPASAHHGWGGYSVELNESMTVTEVRWINPHDIVIAKDASGKEWRLLLAPPLRNRRFGFGPGTIEVGDVVQILGAAHASRAEAKVHVITRKDEEVYRYYYDSGLDSQKRIGGTVQQPRNKK